MRVAVRRARALLRAGKPLIETDTQMLSLELKWLGGILGDVRDLDVLLARVRGEAASLDPADRKAAGRLLRSLERQRTRARRAMLKALDGRRYATLLDRFEDTLGELAPAAVDLTLDAVVKRAKALQDVLGEHQDSTVAEDRLRTLSRDAPPDQALAAGRLVERERELRAQARASWRGVWRRLERAAR